MGKGTGKSLRGSQRKEVGACWGISLGKEQSLSETQRLEEELTELLWDLNDRYYVESPLQGLPYSKPSSDWLIVPRLSVGHPSSFSTQTHFFPAACWMVSPGPPQLKIYP